MIMEARHDVKRELTPFTRTPPCTSINYLTAPQMIYPSEEISVRCHGQDRSPFYPPPNRVSKTGLHTERGPVLLCFNVTPHNGSFS
jgi:hypothetical protein